MRTLFRLAMALALVAGGAVTASAHFVWIAVQPAGEGGRAAHVYFSEAASPDDPDLLDKIAAVQAHWLPLEGPPSALKLAKNVAAGSWTGTLADQGRGAAAATIPYGVIARGGKTMFLHYYAKYLETDPGLLAKLGRNDRLPLDIVPSATPEGWQFTVLWKGQPAAKSEVVVDLPGQKTEKQITDDAGVVRVAHPIAGLASLRARWIVAQPGEHDGQKYEIETHYCTLALRGPEAPAAAAATAPALLAAAREGRALWKNFPGFRAKLEIFAAGAPHQGEVTITAAGRVELKADSLKDPQRVLATLRSMVGHRLADSEASQEVSFPDAGPAHPLGRLVKLDYDSAMASTYRVRDGVIAQVNREMGGGHFTISVLDVHRNAEGKYLPSVYAVSTWDKEGALQSTTTVRETWVRVGSFDLPATHFAVTAGPRQNDYTKLVFSGHELLAPAAK